MGSFYNFFRLYKLLTACTVLHIQLNFVSATRRRRDIKIKILFSLPAPVRKKLNIVINDHGRTYKCDFSVFDRKFQKIKMISLSWNLVPRLIRICRTQQWRYFFSVLDWKRPFWTNLVKKIKIVSLNWNLVPRITRICRIQWHCSLFLFQTRNTFLRLIWSKK